VYFLPSLGPSAVLGEPHSFPLSLHQCTISIVAVSDCLGACLNLALDYGLLLEKTSLARC
jgi:hypothetical protein